MRTERPGRSATSFAAMRTPSVDAAAAQPTGQSSQWFSGRVCSRTAAAGRLTAGCGARHNPRMAEAAEPPIVKLICGMTSAAPALLDEAGGANRSPGRPWPRWGVLVNLERPSTGSGPSRTSRSGHPRMGPRGPGLLTTVPASRDSPRRARHVAPRIA